MHEHQYTGVWASAAPVFCLQNPCTIPIPTSTPASGHYALNAKHPHMKDQYVGVWVSASPCFDFRSPCAIPIPHRFVKHTSTRASGCYARNSEQCARNTNTWAFGLLQPLCFVFRTPCAILSHAVLQTAPAPMHLASHIPLVLHLTHPFHLASCTSPPFSY